MKGEPLRMRFWRQVRFGDGCWNWQGALSEKGYPLVRIGKRNVKGHRVAFGMMRGAVGDKHVLHECDNPACVRPDHLFLGTPVDNMRDKQWKGRAAQKLTGAEVLDIRASITGERGELPKLAREYGVSIQQIWKIKHRLDWQHV